MTDDSDLLAAILEVPADDNRRLVYADWLQEHGQDDRAEFIRAQATTPLWRTWYNGSIAMANRIDELLRRNGHEWLGPYYEACNGRNWIWHRGFVAEVACTAADWLAHGDAIRAAHPVERVGLTTVPKFDDTRFAFAVRSHNGGATYSPRWPGVEFALPAAPEQGAWNVVVGDMLEQMVLGNYAVAPAPPGPPILTDGTTGCH